MAIATALREIPPAVRAPTPPRTLAEIYRRYFQAVPADTPERQRQAHLLRYQVYCVEHAYLDPAVNPGALERDEFDEHSVQGILLHRDSGATVGSVRLVLHRPGADTPSLPIHRECSHPFLATLPLDTTVELGRFAIAKSFRRRTGDGDYGRFFDCEELANDPRRIIPHITLGLFEVALRLGVLNGARHVLAVMEPALLRLVARFGFHFQTLGPLVNFHGWRQPCYATVEGLILGVETERPDVWGTITDHGRIWAPRLGRSTEALR